MSHDGRLRDHVAHAQLLAGLRAKLAWVLARKCAKHGLMSPIGDRATLASQFIGNKDGNWLIVYEAGYRATLYPRVVYKVEAHVGDGHEAAIREAIRMEQRTKDRVVAMRDRRMQGYVEGDAWVFAGALLDWRGNTTEEPLAWAKDHPSAGRCSARQTVLVNRGTVDEDRVRIHGGPRCELAHGHPGRHRAGSVEWDRLDPARSTE